MFNPLFKFYRRLCSFAESSFFIFFTGLLFTLSYSANCNQIHACGAPLEPVVELFYTRPDVIPGEPIEITMKYRDYNLVRGFMFDFFRDQAKEQTLHTSNGDPLNWAKKVYPANDKRMLECMGDPPGPVSDTLWKVTKTIFIDTNGNASAFNNPEYKKLINLSPSKIWKSMPPDGYLACLLPGNKPDIFVHPNAMELDDFLARYSEASENQENILNSAGNTIEVTQARWCHPSQWKISNINFLWSRDVKSVPFKNLDSIINPSNKVKWKFLEDGSVQLIFSYSASDTPGPKLMACRIQVKIDITGCFEWYEIVGNKKHGPFRIFLSGVTYKNNYLEKKIEKDMLGTACFNLGSTNDLGGTIERDNSSQ